MRHWFPLESRGVWSYSSSFLSQVPCRSFGFCLDRGLTSPRISCEDIWNSDNTNPNSMRCTSLSPPLGIFLQEQCLAILMDLSTNPYSSSNFWRLGTPPKTKSPCQSWPRAGIKEIVFVNRGAAHSYLRSFWISVYFLNNLFLQYPAINLVYSYSSPMPQKRPGKYFMSLYKTVIFFYTS